jgi:hypothetical protein
MAQTRTYWPTNSSYLEYLNSPEWKARRKAVLERCNRICERCHKYLVDEVHHLTYEHVFNEPLEDLQGLCKPCHKFLHRDSGIDPLVKSVRIKVASKVIEHWDSKAQKFRRISIDKLPPDNFRWCRTYSGGELLSVSLTEQMGLYDVPMDLFLDGQGNPVFQPSRWDKYKVGSRHGRRWMPHGPRGRPIPPDPERVKQEMCRQEERKRREEQRMRGCPQQFASYQGDTARTAKEVMALFRKHPRIVSNGGECTILSVRETKTKGIVLALQCDNPGGGWIRYKIDEAGAKLAQGDILWDRERQLWVVTKQGCRPERVLAQLGLASSP